MKKNFTILRLGEISWVDLLVHLLKNGWIALLMALAAALTTWTVIAAKTPDQYTGSVILSVRSTASAENWGEQFTASKTATLKLYKAITDGTVNTNFASEAINQKISVSVTPTMVGSEDQKTVVTNLLTITVAANSQDEVYFYLTALVDNLDTLVTKAALTNVTVDSIVQPTMPTSSHEYVGRSSSAFLAAIAVGFLTFILIAFIKLTECAPATRRAAERLLVLPVAGTLVKGKRGSGTDAVLPVPISDDVKGLYTKNLADTAEYLLAQHEKLVHVLPLSSKLSRDGSNHSLARAERVALCIALSMATGNARVCLIDEMGEALDTLGIKAVEGEHQYAVPGSDLTICTQNVNAIDCEAYDKVIFAAPASVKCENCHRLWVMTAGRHTADRINSKTTSDGSADTSASVLLYGLWAERDTLPKMHYVDEDKEVDLVRWMIAALKVLDGIKLQSIALLVAATVVGTIAGLFVEDSSLRIKTEFAVMTADVTAKLDSEQINSMTLADAMLLMSEGSNTSFNGNAHYATARPLDYDTLLSVMPTVWNSQATVKMIESYLGKSLSSVAIYISPVAESECFVLSVRGNDKELLEEVTNAFFEVASGLSAHTAGGLSFISDESKIESAGTSVLSVLLGTWVVVLAALIAYAMIVGYNDRTILQTEEAERLLGVQSIGRISRRHRRTTKQSGAGKVDVCDINLTRFVRNRISESKSGRILMITSALREEGADQLTATVESLIKQNGKRVVVADKTVCERLLRLSDDSMDNLLSSLWNKCDYLLLDCPGMAIDCEVAKLAEKADGVIWALRMGYAHHETVSAALARMEHKEKILGSVIVTEH